MLTHHVCQPTDPDRVVVLGANGFLGRALNAVLLRAGIRSLGLGSQDLDLEAPGAAEQLAAVIEPSDAVVMLAAITPGRGRGVQAFMQNLTMAAALARAFDSVVPAHVTYISSAAVYRAQSEPITEETLPAPAELFGMMHLARETLLTTTARCPIAILRPTLMHGQVENMRTDDHVLSFGPDRLRRLARENGRIVLSGGGEELQDYLATRDAARLILATIRRRSSGILNLATGRSVALIDLARMIATLFNRPIPVEVTARHGPPVHRRFDVSALTRAFPDFVFTPLEEALAEDHAAGMGN